MKVSVGQFSPGGDIAQNLATMRRLATGAAQDGVELIIFPEESMFSIGQVEGDFTAAVDGQWTTFVRELSLLAAGLGIAIIAGGYESSGEDRPYNTVLAVDGSGGIAGTYRKLHLYDAFSFQESERIKPGGQGLGIVDIGGFKVGIMTCYDLRFPELARALAVAGVDVLSVSAAWFKGEYKVEHWETLLKARAIENTCWVVAAGTSSSHCIGHSTIVDPLGVAVAALTDDAEATATAELTHQRLKDVREILPVLDNRRLESSSALLPQE